MAVKERRVESPILAEFTHPVVLDCVKIPSDLEDGFVNPLHVDKRNVYMINDNAFVAEGDLDKNTSDVSRLEGRIPLVVGAKNSGKTIQEICGEFGLTKRMVTYALSLGRDQVTVMTIQDVVRESVGLGMTLDEAAEVYDYTKTQLSNAARKLRIKFERPPTKQEQIIEALKMGLSDDDIQKNLSVSRQTIFNLRSEMRQKNGQGTIVESKGRVQVRIKNPRYRESMSFQARIGDRNEENVEQPKVQSPIDLGNKPDSRLERKKSQVNTALFTEEELLRLQSLKERIIDNKHDAPRKRNTIFIEIPSDKRAKITVVREAMMQKYAEKKQRYIAFCKSFDLTSEEAEDIVQDSFLTGYLKAENYHDDTFEGLEPWLIQIMKRKSLTELKRKHRIADNIVYLSGADSGMFKKDVIDSLEDTVQVPMEEFVELKVLKEQVRRSILAIPQESARKALTLRLEGFSYGEIGYILNFSSETARTAVFRGKGYLKSPQSELYQLLAA